MLLFLFPSSQFLILFLESSPCYYFSTTTLLSSSSSSSLSLQPLHHQLSPSSSLQHRPYPYIIIIYPLAPLLLPPIYFFHIITSSSSSSPFYSVFAVFFDSPAEILVFGPLADPLQEPGTVVLGLTLPLLAPRQDHVHVGVEPWLQEEWDGQPAKEKVREVLRCCLPFEFLLLFCLE